MFHFTSVGSTVAAILGFFVSKLYPALVFWLPDKPLWERSTLQLLLDGVQELRYGEILPRVGFDGGGHRRKSR